MCATAQTRQFPTNDGNQPRASARNRKLSTKPSAIQKIHCRGRSPKKADRHGDTTSLPVPTGGPVNMIWTGFSARYVTEYSYLLQSDRRNQPQGKYIKNDGASRPCETSSMTYRTIGKGQIIHTSRRAENFRRNDGVQRDHYFGIYSHL